MSEAIFLFIAVFFMFRVVFTNEWEAPFYVKVIIYFIGTPVVAYGWIAMIRYFS